MKITKSQLKQIIKEEIEATLDEKFKMPAAAKDMTVGMGNAPDKAREAAARKEKCVRLKADAEEAVQEAESMARSRNQWDQFYAAQQGKLARMIADNYKTLCSDAALQEDLY